MNMKTALRKLYKAISGEDNYKVNTSKLLVDIHKALTNKEPVNKNNHARIISELADNWTGGGGGGGSSDFSIAEITVASSGTAEGVVFFIGITEDGLTNVDLSEGSGGSPETGQVVLYKGVNNAFIDTSSEVSVSGSAIYDSGSLTITGDCTVTFS